MPDPHAGASLLVTLTSRMDMAAAIMDALLDESPASMLMDALIAATNQARTPPALCIAVHDALATLNEQGDARLGGTDIRVSLSVNALMMSSSASKIIRLIRLKQGATRV
ncbi:MAG: hypothetical protein IPK52_12790 [Chloroflexi bacterium]|nr:hypothetical protein [Chloroflexota bacterium]